MTSTTGAACTWSADGNLLLNNFGRLLKVGLDGKSQTQLLADPSARMFTPFSCGTNYIVLTWQGSRGHTFEKCLAYQCRRYRSLAINPRR